MRFSTVIWVSLACFALVAAAIIGSIKTLGSAEQYEETLKTYVRAATGRDLVVNGTVEILSDLPPRLIMTNVALANPEGMSRKEMVRIGRMEIEADLRSLFLHALKVRRVSLTDVDLLLQRNEGGETNWEFSVFEPRPGESLASSGLPPFPDFGAMREMTVKRLQLRWIDRDRTDSDIQFDELEFTMSNPVTPMSLVGNGRYEEAPFSLSGTLGGLSTLWNALNENHRYPVRVRGQGEKLTVVLDGAIESEKGEKPRFSGDLRLSGRDFPGLRRYESGPFPGPFVLSGLMEVSGDGISLNRMDARMGLSGQRSLQYRGRIGTLLPFGDLDGKLSVRLDSLRDLSSWAGIGLPRLGPVRMDVTARQREGRTQLVMREGRFGGDIIDATLMADVSEGTLRGDVTTKHLHAEAWSQGWNRLKETSGSILPPVLDVTLKADKVSYRTVALQDAAMNMKISGRDVVARPFSASMGDGTISGWFVWDRTDHANLWLEGRGLNSGEIVEALTGYRMPQLGRGSLFATLSAQGGDLVSLLDELQGESWVLVENGRIPRLDFLRPLLPRGASFECLAAVAKMGQGGIRRSALLLDGRFLVVGGQGSVTLTKDGEVDLLFAIQDKHPEDAPTNVIGLRGTLSDSEFISMPYMPAALPPIAAGDGEVSPCLMTIVQKSMPGVYPPVFRKASLPEDSDRDHE